MKRIGLCFCLTIVFAALLCGCGSEKKNLPSSTEQNEVFSSAGKQAEPESTESQDVTERKRSFRIYIASNPLNTGTNKKTERRSESA